VGGSKTTRLAASLQGFVEGGSNLRRFAGVSEAGARSRNAERFWRGIWKFEAERE